MQARVRRWGNSLAVRLPKEELDRLGIQEGDEVEVAVKKAKRRKKIDLSHLPTFHDPDPLASEHHDELLYGPRGKR